MTRSKLISLLRSLSPAELREFRDYIASPVFNKNKNIISLFNALKRYYPKFESEDLTEENICSIVFPAERYDYYRMKNLISDLLGLGKEYLAFNHYRDVSNVKDAFLLTQLRERSLDSLFSQSFKAYEKRLENLAVKDESYLSHRLALLEEEFSFYSPKEPNKRYVLRQGQLDQFIELTMIRLLKYYSIMLHENQQNNHVYDMKLFNEIMEYVRKNKSESNPTIVIYYFIILLKTEKNKKNFFELKKAKERYFNELSIDDRFMTILHMTSYCVYVSNVIGTTDFIHEHFLLTKEKYEKGLSHLGKMLYPDLLQDVKVAVRVNKFEWAEDLIAKYQKDLTEAKEDTLNFCYGYILYKRGRLDEALERFLKTNFSIYILKVQVRILMLQIQYEKEGYEEALSMVDAFRHYLSREKLISDELKESFYGYLKVINELTRIKTSPAGKGKGYSKVTIKKEIEKIQYNQYGIKLWLKKMLESL